jgi:hypothetical protein
LRFVGIKKSRKVLSEGADTDIIEFLLQLFVDCSGLIATPPGISQAEGDCIDQTTAEEEVKKEESSDDKNVFDTSHLFAWLKLITMFAKFDLALKFASPSLISGVGDLFTNHCSAYEWLPVADKYGVQRL